MTGRRAAAAQHLSSNLEHSVAATGSDSAQTDTVASRAADPLDDDDDDDDFSVVAETAATAAESTVPVTLSPFFNFNFFNCPISEQSGECARLKWLSLVR